MQEPPTFATNRRVGCIMWLAIVALSLSVIGMFLDITQELAWNQRVEQALSVAPVAQVAPTNAPPAASLPPDDTPAALVISPATPEIAATPIPQTTGPSYEAVCDADTNNMTDPQITAFAKQWIGQRFSGWQGWVYDVVSNSDGTYDLQISMEERSFFWNRDVVIENIVSDLATRLNVEQIVTFSGRVARNDVFLDSLCNPLIVDDYVLNE
jgi:hypothetical protein